MKFCPNCGNQMDDTAMFCSNCGFQQNAQPYQNVNPVYNNYPVQEAYATESALKTVAKVFMILSTVILGLSIIPLAWCIPMTVYYFNRTKYRQPVGVGFKICTLIFVNIISGVLMLCDNEC